MEIEVVGGQGEPWYWRMKKAKGIYTAMCNPSGFVSSSNAQRGAAAFLRSISAQQVPIRVRAGVRWRPWRA